MVGNLPLTQPKFQYGLAMVMSGRRITIIYPDISYIDLHGAYVKPCEVLTDATTPRRLWIWPLPQKGPRINGP